MEDLDSESLPPGWLWARLDEVCDICDYERAPVKREIREARCAGKLSGDLVPYYGATGQAGWIDAPRSSGSAILLGEDGAPFLDMGKPKAYRVSGSYWVNNHAHVLRPRDPRLEDIILHQLNIIDYTDFVSGTTRLKLTSESMRRIKLAIPPPKEAERVGNAIEALFEEIEAGDAALMRARESLTQFRASVLHAACTGALTADWRTTNASNQTARELLLDIATWRTKRGLKPISKPDTCNQAASPRLPPGWTWTSLPQLGEFGRGKSKHRPRDDARLYGEAIPFIQTGEVSRSRGLINSWTKMYSDFGISQSKIWPAGTVCITIAANIAASGILAFDACFPDSVVGLITPNPAVSRYVELFIQTARANLSAYAPATAQKNINLDILNSIAVPLPPLSEIQAIVETVEALEQEAFQPLNQISDTVALRQSILHAAFTGRLVPQDPADEPAEALLARLRATPTPARRPRPRRGATQPDLIETEA